MWITQNMTLLYLKQVKRVTMKGKTKYIQDKDIIGFSEINERIFIRHYPENRERKKPKKHNFWFNG